MGGVFTTKVYIVPGANRPFYHERDARGYCEDNGIDKSRIVKYDSTLEYNRYLTLVEMQRKGEISGLQRQVEFLLVPDQTERQYVGTKQTKRFAVNVKTDNTEPLVFDTRKQATEFCRLHKIKLNNIIPIVEDVEVYKDVVQEKKMVYTADFVYYKDGQKVVEDAKSDFTRKQKDYVQRRKLMLWIHKIKILETK